MRSAALPLALIALALSGSALFLGIHNRPVVVTAPPVSTPAERVVIAPAEPSAELAAAHRRIAALEAKVAALAVERTAAVEVVEAVEATPTRRYERLLPPPDLDLEVEETENGALAVINHDPRLTHQVVIIQGEQADGTQVPVTIVVPPPEG